MTRTNVLPNIGSIVAAMALGAGCAEPAEPTGALGSVESPGMLNGMLNGMFRTEGLSTFLQSECPLLQQRLMGSGALAESYPAAFAAEIAKPICDRFMFYTVQAMLPAGETLDLTAGGEPVASYPGKMNLQHLIAQAHPQYTFEEHAFLPAYKIARVLVTQVYAALTNGITRTVSFKTNIPALDEHRAPAEDAWPRELAQLVPATPVALAAMVAEPAFLDRLPDFFRPCNPALTNYDYLQPACSTDSPSLFAPTPVCQSVEHALLPEGHCPVPVVVHGNLDFVNDLVPGRSCRIRRPGELAPAGTITNGDVIIPEEGCALIYYAGRIPDVDIYDDRALNPTGEGCDFSGPSAAGNCYFNINQEGMQISPDRIATWIFNVQPVAAQ